MALISIIENFEPMNDPRLLERADQLTPELRQTTVRPIACFQMGDQNGESFDPGRTSELSLTKGQNLCFDFGRHLVGYITLELGCTGSHPDAPAFLKLNLAEMPGELKQKSEDYHGWVSGSWIQEEFIHVDVLPARIRLPRRYAFRYLKVTVLETSPKYQLTINAAECTAVSSADWSQVEPLRSGDPILDRIDEISLNTLAECMQDVFEDGPKRDQRLWLGDLRLEALSNYVSFRNLDLVRRCLYLFGGSRFPDGRAGACLFVRPEARVDDTYLFDYALLYPVILEEYLQQTEDRETLDDLYEVAMQQIEISLAQCNDQHIDSVQAGKDTFIDWCDDMDKRACAQAVLIYALSYARRLAHRRGDSDTVRRLTEQEATLKQAARDRFWDSEKRCFVSNGQVSLATQVWMTLADVLSSQEAADLMVRSEQFMDDYPMSTPYMHHYYIMALIHAGLKEKALAHLKEYWGGMVDAGADTFWESWNPADPDGSPYGGSIVNSYCHGWSCTPAYLLRSLLLEAES